MMQANKHGIYFSSLLGTSEKSATASCAVKTSDTKWSFNMKLNITPLALTCAILWGSAAGDTSIAAVPLLVNITRAGQGAPATPQDFAAAGVKENLSGATVASVGVPSTAGSSFGVAGLVFAFSNPFNASYDVSPWGSDQSACGNALLDSYVYLNSGGLGPGPVTVTISGLRNILSPGTRYRFYLFGTAGSNQNQNAEFTFPPGGVTKTTLVPGGTSAASASFYFTTGSVVSDSIAFTWARVGTDQYSAFNGIAITVAQFQTAPVPNISRIAKVGGAVDILFHGETGRDYVLETSLDLKTWTPLPLTPVVEQNDWEFIDTNTETGMGSRFYRVKAQLSSN